MPIAMKRGQGSYIWDADDTHYIDFFAGFGCGGVAGHCDPRIAAAVAEQAQTLCSHGNLFTNAPQVELARRIVETSFNGKVFFCHSGAEANEAAIKVVRRAVSAERYKIISFENCFHGRTMGGLSLCPSSFQTGFEPMLPGNLMLPYGDLTAVEQAVDSETAAIFVEPIQGEGGINVASTEFLQGLRSICNENDLLLVCDEVWSAPARTGRWYAYQYFGIEPDVMTLAKALGGGLPVGACVVADKWSEVLSPGTHGCTMGGNPLCAAAGVAAMKLIEDENLCQRAEQIGTKIQQALGDANIAYIKEIRGKGTMLGAQLDESVPAKDIMVQCMEAGLIICTAKQNAIRIAPALTTPDEVVDAALEILLKVLNRQ